MRKICQVSLITATTIVALVAGGSAFADQNVANTSQKGSLLVWPLITVDHLNGASRDTVVEISNDANVGVHVECEYVNERKGRVNFDFNLTAKQTASWDVLTLSGDHIHPPPFPTHAGVPQFPGNAQRGELICFATNTARAFQVAFNHLTGTATVMSLNDTTAAQPQQAFKYNAWAFAARSDVGLAPDNEAVPHGTPGQLVLNGDGAGTYDACPAYNIANFMPNGATLGNLRTLNNTLAVVSCNQDLRESYRIHTTKLDFTVWNSLENSFTGAYYCADSVTSVNLADPPVTAGRNFDFSTLRTQNARFEVRGVSATPPCPFVTEVSGLLGVLKSSAAILPGRKSDGLIGNTLHAAGILPGFILWDPAGSVGGAPRH
jgi:hypothetical protein